MHFRTELQPDKLPTPIQLTDRLVTVGSCFAEVMGQRLADHKLHTLVNPLGTLFSPDAISKALTLALTNSLPDPAGYIERDGLWFHYDFHSSLWGTSQQALAETLQVRLREVGHALREANWLVLTLGSAVVYRHIETGQVVANCHKMPDGPPRGTLFEKYLSHIDHVRDDLTKLFRLLRRHHPTLNVLLTVSPVRHVRDGLALNGASKALLRTLCAELPVWHPNVHYFPAYELVQDDLRDYRFYEADLIHPNAQAHDYVFTKFAQSAFSPDLCAFVQEWRQIRKGLAHRPLHGPTEAHRRFLQSLLNRLNTLPVTIDTTTERAELEEKLRNYVPI